MKSLIAIGLLALTACVDQPLDDQSQDDGFSPKLGANGLTPTQLFNTALDPAVLDQTNLDTMAATDDGRVTLRYVVSCALALNHNVTANYTDGLGNPQTLQLNGFFGLADGWTSTALSTTSQRFVSSCTLALTNEIGASITVSLRGPSTALATTSPELSGYTLQEGAFFGNVFKGAEGAAACKGSGTSTQSGRTCSRSSGGGSTYCGFTYVGTCTSVCSTSSGYFTNCSWNSTTYTTAVSTYLPN